MGELARTVLHTLKSPAKRQLEAATRSGNRSGNQKRKKAGEAVNGRMGE